MTTASQVKSAASKAAKAAQQAAVKAGQLANDPNKIDSFILRVLIWGLLLIPPTFLLGKSNALHTSIGCNART